MRFIAAHIAGKARVLPGFRAAAFSPISMGIVT